jgi:N-acetyl-gamma-glutamyl-phosphate reductase
LFHPAAEIVLVTANEHAGKRVSDVHRNLLGLTELSFDAAASDLGELADVDLAFFALPHGQGAGPHPSITGRRWKAIDLSGDFRIDDPAVFKAHYNLDHTASDLQDRFVYGLTETNRDAISNAQVRRQPGMLCDGDASRP